MHSDEIISRWTQSRFGLTREGWTIVKSVCPEEWTRDTEAGGREAADTPRNPGSVVGPQRGVQCGQVSAGKWGNKACLFVLILRN